MAIESNKQYILIYVSISFKNNINFLKKIQKEFGFEIPYLDVPVVSEELRSVLDSYIYLEESLNTKNIFLKLYQKYKQITFTDLGLIPGKEIYKLINSCISTTLNSVKVGEYYKLIKHPLKNLIIKVISIEGDFVVGEYTVMNEVQHIKVPITKISSFKNIYQVEKDSQFINYMELARKMNKKKAIVVDGHNMLFRNMFGYDTKYTAKDHIFVGGAYGMYFSLLKLKSLFPEYEIHLIFDGYDEEKFKENPKYKIHRQRLREKAKYALNNNLRWVREFAFNVGLSVYHLKDKEGDDVVGSVVKFLIDILHYEDVIIYSTDRDFYSIVSDKVSLYVPRVEFRGSSKRVFKKDALNEFGVTGIHKINWCKSISGDKSDNICTINMYNKEKGIKCSQVKSKDYLTTINESDSFDEVKTRLSLIKKFKNFIQEGVMDKNFKLLTINQSLLNNKVDLSEFQGICNYDNAVKLLEEFAFYKELEGFERNFRIFRGIW